MTIAKRIGIAMLFAIIACIVSTLSVYAKSDDKPINLGTQRELFIDDYLIESMSNAELRVHEPVRKNIIMRLDKPWEGSGCGYATTLYDPQLKKFRMYYKSWDVGVDVRPLDVGCRLAMLESKDGITWTRPELGLVEFQGNKKNNLIFKYGHDFSPFIDPNPKAKPEERYKGIGLFLEMPRFGGKTTGLWAYSSPDGLNWKPMKDAPVFTKGAFDSQNVSFWSETEKQYVLYYRVFENGTPENGVRHIRRAVSDDFINWKEEGLLQFPPGEGPALRAQFYVNQIAPYPRANHIYIGFPSRYVDNGMTASTKLLPEWDKREKRIKAHLRYGTAVTDAVFISSRDGLHFRQSNDVFLRPNLRTKDNWSYGDNYLAWRVIETQSTEPDSPRELSFYATESYFTGNDTIFRRYTLRLDGFGSIHAKNREGIVTTHKLTFGGARLSLNCATSAAGLISVELCDANGKPIPGFTRADCDVIYGDSLDRTVTWKGASDVSKLKGKPVVLKFYMQEADVYSLKFE